LATVVQALLRHRFHFKGCRSQRQIRQDALAEGRKQAACPRASFKPRKTQRTVWFWFQIVVNTEFASLLQNLANVLQGSVLVMRIRENECIALRCHQLDTARRATGLGRFSGSATPFASFLAHNLPLCVLCGNARQNARAHCLSCIVLRYGRLFANLPLNFYHDPGQMFNLHPGHLGKVIRCG
jgi:hypothetical protein